MKEDTRKKIIAKAVKGRRQKGSEVARCIGVSASTVNRAIRGGIPSYETAQKLIDYLKINRVDAVRIFEMIEDAEKETSKKLSDSFKRSSEDVTRRRGRQYRPFSHLQTLSRVSGI